MIVRSTRRPSLARRWRRSRAQDYPHIEIVVVAASAARDIRPLPERCGPHPLRSSHASPRRLRPDAANTGLDAATGDWITFLDDDDTLLPDHVSGLMAATRARAGGGRHPLLARARRSPTAARSVSDSRFAWCSSTSATSCTCRRPCSRARCSRAAAASTKRSLMHQDWDFFLQIAAVHASFHFVPRETFDWNADAAARVPAAASTGRRAASPGTAISIYAKWAPARDALIDRVDPMLQAAAGAGAAARSRRRRSALPRGARASARTTRGRSTCWRRSQRATGASRDARATQETRRRGAPA